MITGIYSPLVGRFGNACFQYAHARALAEREGCELVTPRWSGERIFEIAPTREKCGDDFQVGGYGQNQESLIYTRAQVRRWFKFQPWVLATLGDIAPLGVGAIGHRRSGDYFGYGYPVVSQASYNRAFKQHSCNATLSMVTEENPARHPAFTGNLVFVPDFLRLTFATELFRGNSTFSWWAATLGYGKVFSPMVSGLVGGREHDVEFVEGNHPKFCDLANVTDLHLPEE